MKPDSWVWRLTRSSAKTVLFTSLTPIVPPTAVCKIVSFGCAKIRRPAKAVSTKFLSITSPEPTTMTAVA